MLIHIVCWKYRPDVDADARDEHRRRLLELKTLIPCASDLEVGADMLHLERSYDTGLIVRFADRAELDVYTVDPAHQKVAELGKTIAERVVSVDFITDDAA